MKYIHNEGVLKHTKKASLVMIALALVAASSIAFLGVTNAADPCLNTTKGSANYVNEVPEVPFTVTCDIGIYFNEDATLDGVEINATAEDSKKVQYGIYVDDANVDVQNSIIDVEAAYANQFVGITHRNGAEGKIFGNKLTGAFRAAIVTRGPNTNTDIKNNSIIGTGANTDGWAENGIQVDQGAVANIINNSISGFWWDGNSNWASTAVLLYGTNGTKVVNNSIKDSEFSIYVVGDGNKVSGNRVTSSVTSQSDFSFQPYGVLVDGKQNSIAGNSLWADNGAIGVYFFGGSERNRLTGNKVSGFEYTTYDGGNNIVRGLVTPKE